MDISLIIPAHNEEGYIGACLESVQKYGKGFKEVIVVDNASTDRTAEIARGFDGVLVVYKAEKGLTHARQAGLEASSGEILAYIDADSRLPEHWVAMVEKIFTERPDAVSLSGPGRYYDANAYERFMLGAGWWMSAPLLSRLVGYMVFGANFALRRSAIEKIGGFDTGIAFYGEDTTLARSLSKVGKTIFRMDFFIYTSARRYQDHGIWRMNFIYSMNFLWPVLFGRPFTKEYKDVRKSA